MESLSLSKRVSRIFLTNIPIIAALVSTVAAAFSIYFAIASDQSVRVTLVSSNPIGTNTNFEFFESTYVIFNTGRHPVFISDLATSFDGGIHHSGEVPYQNSSPYIPGGRNLGSDAQLASPISLLPGGSTEIRILDRAELTEVARSVVFEVEAPGLSQSEWGLSAFAPATIAGIGTSYLEQEGRSVTHTYREQSSTFFASIAKAALAETGTRYFQMHVAGYEGTLGCQLRDDSALVLGCTNLTVELTSGETFSSGDYTIGRRIELFEPPPVPPAPTPTTPVLDQ